MDFKRPARSQPERTGREDRRLKFYGLRDNLDWTRLRPSRSIPEVRRFAASMGALLAAIAGCGGSDLESEDPRSTVRGFYEAILRGDGEDACRRLTPSARALLTVKQPAPPCEDAISKIEMSLGAGERRSMTGGLRVDRAMRVTRQASTADVDLATRDSSGAGIHLRLEEGRWRIHGVDPGAVDGGQPTDDARAIERLHSAAR